MVKSGNEVVAGDVLMRVTDGSHIGDVQDVRPYTGPLIDLLGEGTQIGTFYGGMEMTLPANSFFRAQ